MEGKAVYLAEAVLKITTVSGVLKDELTFAPRDHNSSTIICSTDAALVCRTRMVEVKWFEYRGQTMGVKWGLQRWTVLFPLGRGFFGSTRYYSMFYVCVYIICYTISHTRCKYVIITVGTK